MAVDAIDDPKYDSNVLVEKDRKMKIRFSQMFKQLDI